MTNQIASPGDHPASQHHQSNPLDHAVSARDRQVIAMVRDALSRDALRLAYQPVVMSREPQRVAFWEGLVRVMDPSGRIIPARQFIHEAETDEVGRALDCASLRMGLDALNRVPDMRLSINMSARSIGYPEWRRTLEDGLARNATVAERLILEITEHSAIVMPDITQVFMGDLQRRGISFALDDFGAGYTAFRYLKKLCFDILKIDAQFIHNIGSDIDNQVIVAAMRSIAEQFEMFTVAEAVETEAEATMLRSYGIDCLQGYFYGAPMITPPWLDTNGRATG